MKSLKIIQVLAKIARILCKILFIVCIVGASFSLLGLISLPLSFNFEISEGKTLIEYFNEQNLSAASAITSCAVALFTCGVGIFLSKYNELFYKRELDIGTPFKMEVVNDMRRVALVNIIVNISVYGAAAIAIAIVQRFYPDVKGMDNSFVGSVSYGLTLLLISLFCEYSAEKDKQNIG